MFATTLERSPDKGKEGNFRAAWRDAHPGGDTQGVRIGQVEHSLLPRPGMAGDVGKWASHPERQNQPGRGQG